MRLLDDDTLIAQSSPSPEYEVTATFEPHGRGPFDRPVGNFAPLVTNLPGANGGVVSVVGRADGAFLRFYTAIVGALTELRVSLITEPTLPTSWTSPTWDRHVTIAGLGVFCLDALVVDGTIRLYYSDAGSVRWLQSNDGGFTWSTPVTVETVPGATIYDLSVCYRPGGLGGPWFVGYSTYIDGVYHPRVVGASTGPETVYEAGWRFGGFHHTGETGIALNWLGMFVFRDPEAGPTRIVYGAWGPGTAALTNTTVVDWTQGGLFGVRLGAARTRQVVGTTAMLVLETAYSFGSYLTWSIVYGDATHGPLAGGQPMAVDESMLIGPLSADESMGVNGTIAGTLVDGAGGDLYFCSPYSVFRAPAITAPAGTYTPIKYKYEVGGNLEIQFSARDFPLVPMGTIVVLERTVRKDGVGGSQVIRARVVKREHASDRVRLLAVDALGELGVVRLRRPCILDEAASTYTNTAIACFRGGLAVKDLCEAAAVHGDICLTLKPGENLAGSLHRMGLCQRIWLVPDNGGAYGLTMIVPGKDVVGTGEYGNYPQPYGGDGEHPIMRAADVVDSRRYAVSIILGAGSHDPEDGGGIAMSLGPQVEGCRPVPVAVTNRLITGSTVVTRAAQAEADRQRKICVDATMTAPVNLALELYDLVQVTALALGWVARVLRVHSLIERWEDGRLLQELGMGEA